MKKFLYLFLLLSLSSCYQPEEGCIDIEATTRSFSLSADRACPEGNTACQCDYPTVSMNIEYLYEKTPFQVNSIYKNDIGQYFEIQDIQFYISNIQLIRTDDLVVTVLDTITLTIDNESVQLEKHVFRDDFKLIHQQNTIALGSLNKSGTFQQIQFTIGIKAPENTTAPSLINRTNHALKVDSMYSNTAGYTYNRIVIRKDTSLSESTLLAIGDQQGIISITLSIPMITKQIGENFSIGTLSVNHAKWFDGINFVTNTPEEMREMIVSNTTKVFSFH